MAAEWCEHEPPVLIFERAGTPVQASVTVGAFAPTADVARIRHPDGLLDSAGNLRVNLYAPSFGWSFRLVVRHAGAIVYDRQFGARDRLLPAGQDRVVTVPLPGAVTP